MIQPIILHHYKGSPYSEKIRLMFGYTDTSWLSLISPEQPPRPSLDPLTGGYRRIPVAQIGADIFCDTDLIARELARITERPELDPETTKGSNSTLLAYTESDVLRAALATIPAYRALWSIIKSLGPTRAFRLVKDRQSAFSDGTSRLPRPMVAKQLVHAYLDALEMRLQPRQWVNGDQPSLADFVNYHPIWCHQYYGGKALDLGPSISQWLQNVEALGHGHRTEIGQSDAFDAARSSHPRALPATINDGEPAVGTVVSIAPIDYCVVPVVGTIVAKTEDRIVLARETSDFGHLHVHFPRVGYSVTPQN